MLGFRYKTHAAYTWHPSFGELNKLENFSIPEAMSNKKIAAISL
jgi:hypothetical protein